MSPEISLLLSMPVAAAVHEAGHILTMKLLNIKCRGSSFMPLGIGIYADFSGISYKKELCCCLAGPAVNIIAGLWLDLADIGGIEWSTTMFAYGIFNLLPCKSLDGGRILALVLMVLGMSPERCTRVCNMLSFLCAFAIWTAAIYSALVGGEVLLLVASVYLLMESMGQWGFG